jgi:hypothetical protein
MSLDSHVAACSGQYSKAIAATACTRTILPHPHATAFASLQLEQWGPELQQINRRARLYVCTLPPDQLNPAGYYDGSQTTMLSVRHSVTNEHDAVSW